MKYKAVLTFEAPDLGPEPYAGTIRHILKDWDWDNIEVVVTKEESNLLLPAKSKNNLFAIFDKAKEHLKYPKLKILRNDDNAILSANTRIHFILKGEKSKAPGAIDVTDGKQFPNNKFYARITRGKDNFPLIKWYQDAANDSEAKSVIETVISDPLGFGKVHGQTFCNCMFCGLELTNKNSVTVGYGPICAENWGLPWEGVAEAKEMEKERELINSEFGGL